jgi:16S rRNA processing protein RimM
MAKTEYFELGTLSKPHGLKGAFHLYLDVDDPYDYEDLDAIFLQQGNEMVPYFVEDIQIRDNLNLITLEGVNTLDISQNINTDSGSNRPEENEEIRLLFCKVFKYSM